MAEDFTEEQFDDELPEDVEFAEDTKPSNTNIKRTTPTSKNREAPKNINTPNATTNVDAPKDRYNAFIMPTRIGVIDNNTGRPLAEDSEINNLLLGLITKLLNDVDEIKGSL